MAKPIVVNITNEKGGTGKTTLSVNMASGLAARGRRVLVIDCDPQGHATVRLGMKKEPSIYNLLVRDEEWARCVRAVPPERFGIPGETLPTGKLWVVPSNVETRNIAQSLGDAMVVRERLEELDGTVDVVIIDTSPTPSLLHGAFYSATDYIVYPTELAYTSFDGLVESIRHRMAADKAREAKWGIPPITVAGVVPTKYRSQTNEQKSNLDTLHQQFGSLVWNPIPMRTLWQESESRALPVYAMDPNSEAAGDVWELVDRLESVIYARA
jgi:chromosome partitioning protein